MKNKLSPLQLFLLAFAMICANLFLSPFAFEPAEAACASLGGIFFWLLLSRIPVTVRLPKLLLLPFAVLQLVFGTVRFGQFCESRLSPALPVRLCAVILLLLSFYAISLGLSAIGRFAQVCAFGLPFLLFLLLRGAIGCEILLSGSVSGGVLCFLSAFGDGILLPLFLSTVLPASSPEASPFARADREVSAEALPPVFPGLSPIRFPVLCASLCGALVAVLLSVFTGGQEGDFPSVSAVIARDGEMLAPMFFLCLLPFFLLHAFLGLYAVKFCLSSEKNTKNTEIISSFSEKG